MSNIDDSNQPLLKLAYSRTEAAKMLGFKHPATVDRLVKRGLLHPSRATRRPMFLLEELERFLRETTDTVNL